MSERTAGRRRGVRRRGVKYTAGRDGSALLVSSSPKFYQALEPFLSETGLEQIQAADSVAGARRCALGQDYDYVIVNDPVGDEGGSQFAASVSESPGTICLLLVPVEIYEETRAAMIPCGVFVLAKPVAASTIRRTLGFMAAARARLRMAEKKNLTLQEKMSEIRLVNRAKWILIEKRGMTEPEAHRHIEKQAMDLCITKGQVAQGIIDESEK